MLRRAENVTMIHRRGLFTRKGPVILSVGRQAYTTFGKMHQDAYRAMVEASAWQPVHCGTIGARQYWLYTGRWFYDNEGLTVDQVHALLITRDQRNQTTINRAKTTAAMLSQPTPTVRGAIPDDLKMLVWTRDGGRCRTCGSTVELQFDHIIPVSKGGATSEQNLQILCGVCNRRKGASIV
jgi:5-methylcytosine-specific restriction endonuclease McrA